jgi:hypothetical protein
VFGSAAKSVLGFISKGWHLVTQEKILTLEGKLAYGGKKMLPNSVS